MTDINLLCCPCLKGKNNLQKVVFSTGLLLSMNFTWCSVAIALPRFVEFGGWIFAIVSFFLVTYCAMVGLIGYYWWNVLNLFNPEDLNEKEFQMKWNDNERDQGNEEGKSFQLEDDISSSSD
jgi:hypothetical protein